MAFSLYYSRFFSSHSNCRIQVVMFEDLCSMSLSVLVSLVA